MSSLQNLPIVIPLALYGAIGLSATQLWTCPFSCWDQVSRLYTPSSEETIEARIHRVGLTRFTDSDSVVFLVLEKGTPGVVVMVGPASYLNGHRILLSRGLSIVCSGSSQTIHGRKILIAREIRIDDRKLALRDQGGVALWKPMTSNL